MSRAVSRQNSIITLEKNPLEEGCSSDNNNIRIENLADCEPISEAEFGSIIMRILRSTE